MLLPCCLLVLLVPGRCSAAPTLAPEGESAPSTEPQADLKLAAVSARLPESLLSVFERFFSLLRGCVQPESRVVISAGVGAQRDAADGPLVLSSCLWKALLGSDYVCSLETLM